MLTAVETARDGVREALAFVRGLTNPPESLVAMQLHDGGGIVVFERGGNAGEDEWVAVQLLPERCTALGRLTRQHGLTRWQPAHPRWAARDVRPGVVQVLGRVLSVIHPLEQNGQPTTA